MMKNILYFMTFVALAGMFQSCLFENDMDYPYIKGEITSFEVEGQKSVTIDASSRIVTVVVSRKADMSRIKVVSYKLNAEANLAQEFPDYIDLTSPYSVTVKTYQDYVWTITGEYEEKGPIEVYPWCNSADVDAGYEPAGGAFSIQWKAADAADWTDLADIAFDNEEERMTGRIEGLDEASDYAVRVLKNGEIFGEEYTFATGRPEQLPNMGFDQWWSEGSNPDKPIWYPNPDKNVKIWDTANKGAGSFIGSPTKPVTDLLAVEGEGKQAARLESKNALIAFAAGNLYTGEFLGINGLGAELTWGTPFTGRPKALRGYYAYSPKKIDYVKPPYESLKGKDDKCQILVMLADWNKPFKVNTLEGVFVDQENDPHIIAYAKYESDKDTGGKYEPFELVLDYRRPDATPKYAVVVACASYKGDYFTGGVGSVMYVDEFEFVYE